MNYTIKGKHEVKTAFQMKRRISHRDLIVNVHAPTHSSLNTVPFVCAELACHVGL